MKRILVVNNYSMAKALQRTKLGIFPAHHTWGCDELEKKATLKYFTHTLPVILHRFHISRVWYYIQNIIILFKAIGCDCIYVAASPLVDLIGYMKYKGWYRKRIVIVVHHPRNFSLKKQRYDKIIFICKDAYDKALVDYPDFKNLFIFQNWGPDLNFYEKVMSQTHDVSFISNGITDRDNETLIDAGKKTNAQIAILCNQQSIPHNFNSQLSNISLIYNKGTVPQNNVMSYTDMVDLVSCHSVSVIPTKKGRTTLCGLTSFNDAIALGMPVIMADTTHIFVDLDKYPLGFYYTAENINDLSDKMVWFMRNKNQLDAMSKVARQYAEDNDYSKFSLLVCHEVLNN